MESIVVEIFQEGKEIVEVHKVRSTHGITAHCDGQYYITYTPPHSTLVNIPTIYLCRTREGKIYLDSSCLTRTGEPDGWYSTIEEVHKVRDAFLLTRQLLLQEYERPRHYPNLEPSVN